MLPAQNRLKHNADFKRVYSKGRSISVGPIVVYSIKTDGSVRVGFSVSKKLGNAVKRNRIRRLLREATRALLGELAGGYDVVVVARRSSANASLSDLYEALRRAFSRKYMLG